MNSNNQNLINQIIYRAKYRGTKEMDIFLSSFVNLIIYHLSYDELKDLSELINLNDEQLMQIYKDNKPTEYNIKIINKFREFKI